MKTKLLLATALASMALFIGCTSGRNWIEQGSVSPATNNVSVIMPPMPAFKPMVQSGMTSAATRLTNHVASTRTAQLAWNPSSDANVVGYNVYFGTASGVYTNKVSFGDLTNCIISNLVKNVTYYFAATAVDNQGQESVFSNEAVWHVPLDPYQILTALNFSWGIVLPVKVYSSSDLSSWTDSTNLTGSGCQIALPNLPRCFWRLSAAQRLTNSMTPVWTTVTPE